MVYFVLPPNCVYSIDEFSNAARFTTGYSGRDCSLCRIRFVMRSGGSQFLPKDFFGQSARKNRQKLPVCYCLRRPDSSASPRFDPARCRNIGSAWLDAVSLVFFASLRKSARRHGPKFFSG